MLPDVGSTSSEEKRTADGQMHARRTLGRERMGPANETGRTRDFTRSKMAVVTGVPGNGLVRAREPCGHCGAERALAGLAFGNPLGIFLAGPRHGAGVAFGRKAARFEHVTGFGNGERVEP